MMRLLKVVNIVDGKVFVAFSSTVPVLGVQVVPVPPTVNEPVFKMEFALIVNTDGELEALPSVKLPHSNVEPLTKVILPVLLALLLVPPIVTAPETVSFGLPEEAKVSVPAVLPLVPPSCKLAQTAFVMFTVTEPFNAIVTASVLAGTPLGFQLAASFQLSVPAPRSQVFWA